MKLTIRQRTFHLNILPYSNTSEFYYQIKIQEELPDKSLVTIRDPEQENQTKPIIFQGTYEEANTKAAKLIKQYLDINYPL